MKVIYNRKGPNVGEVEHQDHGYVAEQVKPRYEVIALHGMTLQEIEDEINKRIATQERLVSIQIGEEDEFAGISATMVIEQLVCWRKP